jgi:FkbM family methyltransferase
VKRIARAAIATVMRQLPAEFPRKQWLLLACEYRLTGDHPIVTGRMRLGYRMRIDLRSWVEAFAYYTGRYETELVATALSLMPVGGVALDVGANVGFWAVPFAQRGTVHAFEPVPSNAARLAENAALNGVSDRLCIHEVALSDHAGSAVITLREDFLRGAETGNAALAIDHDDDRFQSLTVGRDTLDSLVSGLRLDRIDVMKVDIEGHEDSFLRGARNTIAGARPVIFIEWNRSYYERRQVDPAARIADALTDLDYIYLRRIDGEHWDLVPAFESPKLLDDLIIAPRETADRIVNA